jgi:enoyl-CoA hydratase/carnithine racemase
MLVERLDDIALSETRYEKKDRIAYVTLDREAAGNSFNVQMCNEMAAIWKDFDRDDDCWVAIVTATGDRFFCTGVDVKESRTRPMGHVWLPVARIMEHLDKPIVCAVNGICCGGGLHFMCDTDIIIGSERAQFFDPHVNVGLVSGWEPIGLSRRIPLNYVLRMALQGKTYRIDAEEAHRIGLVDRVSEDPYAEAVEAAGGYAAGPRAALRAAKIAITWGGRVDLRTGVALERESFTDLFSTEDQKEGMAAFSEKRKASFIGR